MNLIWQICLLQVAGQEWKTNAHVLVGQIGVKNNHSTAFCDEELKFGTVIEEATKSKTGCRAKYYQP